MNGRAKGNDTGKDKNAVHLRAGDRLLITRLDYLGDVILSLPLVDLIQKNFPGVEVDYLTRQPAADLLLGDPRFEHVHVQRRGAGVRDSAGLIREIRARRYRAVIDLYSNPRSAWLTWLSGAPIRIGGDRRGRRHLYTHPFQVPPTVRGAVDHHLYHGRLLGIVADHADPVLSVSESERSHAREILIDAGATSDVVVGMHPGGKWSVKRWPTKYFAELCRLCTDQEMSVVVFSGPGEEQYTRALQDELGDTVSYLDELPIRTAAAVMWACDAFVASDGGAIHLAAAVNTPTVGIFGSAEPDIWFPHFGNGRHRAAFHELECRPCHQHECPLGHTNCLIEVRASYVYDLVRDVLGAKA